MEEAKALTVYTGCTGVGGAQCPDKKPGSIYPKGLGTQPLHHTATHSRGGRKTNFRADPVERLVHCGHSIQVSFFSSSFLTFPIHVTEMCRSKESICILWKNILSKIKKKISL